MELDDILKEIGETAAAMGVRFNSQSAPQNEKSKIEALLKAVLEENKNLKEENAKLREAAQKLLEDFDKVNTMLRDEKAKNTNVKELDKQRKTLYNEATDLRKQRTAYAKALGAIHGALEILDKELK